ncbi:hypothetical protein V6S67_19300 [Arthrobacter sp. Soc17.1.1.1]|uniref:hypothetical protein n=1 Tax=Arthrobacter sp. Soc17.1.1.1 TaxID=3121277 RepID=UPI002FE4D724
MEPLSGPQQDLLRRIVEHAGDLRTILGAQFASCRTAPEEYCAECFLIDVIGDVPLLPADTECPLSFDADVEGGNAPDDPVFVLLWHENGQVDSAEISDVLNHPVLADLQIVERVIEPGRKS